MAEASSAGLYKYYINNIYSGKKKKNAAAEDVWPKRPPQVFIHIIPYIYDIINNIYSGGKKNAAAEDVWAKCPPQVFIHIAYMIALI